MNRMDKVNAQIKREISTMILMGDINDPRLKFITITYADVSKDLRYAKVGFSVLNNTPQEIKGVQEGLNSARGYIRKLIGERIQMRYTPEISFHYDHSMEYSDQVHRTLEEIKRDQQSAEGKS